MLFRGLGEGLVKKSHKRPNEATRHSSTLRLEGFASNSHPLQNTIFIGISGDSENKSSKGPTRHHKCHFSSRFRAFLGEQQAPTGEKLLFVFEVARQKFTNVNFRLLTSKQACPLCFAFSFFVCKICAPQRPALKKRIGGSGKGAVEVALSSSPSLPHAVQATVEDSFNREF